MTYCNSFHGGAVVSGYFVGFKVTDYTGDTLNVVDLTNQVPTNQGKRVNNNASNEPANYSIVPLRITGVAADTTEYWYFGPFANGTPFDIALVDPSGQCDTIFVASGTFNCADMNEGNTDPFACSPPGSGLPVPLFFLDFTDTEFDLGNVNIYDDNQFFVLKRPRESTCCDVGGNNVRCIEMIIQLRNDDIGLLIDDEGSGNTAGKLYADSINNFACTGNTNLTYPFQQGGGQNNDAPLCIPPSSARDFVVLSCKTGNNSTWLSIGTISNIIVPPIATVANCNVFLDVLNVDTAFWSSANDPGLDNLISCTADSLYCTFAYDPSTFGEVTSCEGDTFTYIVGGFPGVNTCIPFDTLLFDTTYVVVFPSFNVAIDSVCIPSANSVLLTANISSLASGCPYDYLWSTGATTQSITVPISLMSYSVTVTRSDVSSISADCADVSDTFMMTGAVDCSNIMSASFACSSMFPQQNPNLLVVNTCLPNYKVFVHDVSNGGNGCGSNPLIISRYYIVDFDGDTIQTLNDRDTCIQLLTFIDNVVPVISCPANITIDCTASTLPAFTGSPTGTDNCDVSLTFSNTNTINGIGCPLAITRIWTATDDCGNTSTCSQLIIITDIVAPSIVCPVVLSPINCPAMPSFGIATATDACDASVAITLSDVTIQGSCTGTYSVSRTWTATDDCGNSSSCSAIIVVEDFTPPVITCVTQTTPINCPAVPVFNAPTATDACDPTVAITFSDATTQGSCAGTYSVTRTWTATDDCGNTATCTGTIVRETTLPTITCVAQTTPISCPEVPVFTDASATDICDANAVITFSDETTQGSCSGTYSVTRTWMATDDCGNSSSCSATIVVHNNTPPEISCPADVTILYSESTLPGHTGTATALDDCDSDQTITFIDSVPTTACPVQNFVIRTWTATDDCGNSATCQQTIIIDDHGSICGTVINDLGDPVPGVQLDLMADINQNQLFDSGDTLVTSIMSDILTGIYCFEYVRPCHYIVVEIQPATFGSESDFDNSADPDGDDSIDGPDNEIPVMVSQGESDLDNNFQDILCPTILPQIVPDTICENGIVTFEIEDLDIGLITYTWDFGSGSNPLTGMGIGPHSVSYVTTTDNQINGSIVELTISKEGCVVLTGQVSQVKVNVYPDATIDPIATPVCYYTNQVFQPIQSQITGATYQWNFGSGAVPATATGFGPHNVYFTTSGSKSVKLVILPNEPGAQCPDSATLVFQVNVCLGNILGLVKSATNAPIATVNVRLFVDANIDGVADTGTPTRSVFTNPSGHFAMASLVPGHYILVETQPAGWTSVDDYDLTDDGDVVSNISPVDNLIPVSIYGGETDTLNVFVETPLPGQINGSVFDDFDLDNSPDIGEGLANVSVGLYADVNINGVADSGTPVAITVTGTTGTYQFASVPVGSYVLMETNLAGYVSVKDFDASNDSDLVPNTNMTNDTIPITITNNENDANNYFIDVVECSLLVTNLNDSGMGSLRYQINCAEDGDTIRFHSSLAGMTILINSGVIQIYDDIVILSTLVPKITISSQVNGLFDIMDNTDVEFRDLNIVSGLSSENGGAAFDNLGVLTLHNISILRNPLFPSGQYLIYNKLNSELILSGNCFMIMD